MYTPFGLSMEIRLSGRYSKQQRGFRLQLGRGHDFDEPDLNVQGEKFKDASIFYTNVSHIDTVVFEHWIKWPKSFNGIIRIW